MELSLKELAFSFIVPFLCGPAPRHLSRIQAEATSSAMYASVSRSFHLWIQPCLEYRRQLFLLHQQRAQRLLNRLKAVMERRTFDAELKTLPTFTPEELVEAMNIAMSRESIGLTTTRAEMPA